MLELKDLEGIIQNPPYSPLSFDIPDSVDGSKRRAIFTKLNYFTADGRQTVSNKEQLAFLEVTFEVEYYNIIVSELPPEDEEGEPIEITSEYVFPDKGFSDSFIADYKTFVNGFTGVILAKSKDNFSPDLEGLVTTLNRLILDGVYTEEQILTNTAPGFTVVTQVKYFEMLFNNTDTGGNIPVKLLIESFAQTANWKDVNVKKI